MSRITLQRDNASGCFRLQSHGKVPTSLLCSMYENNESLSDVSLTGTAPTGGACNMEPIRAHKLILAHASPHLYDLFTVQGFVDTNKPAHTFTTIDHASLCSIVKFIYTDIVDVEEDGAAERIRSILVRAKYLIMKELADACEGFLASSDRIDVQNCIGVFQFAFKYNCTKILGAVCAFIGKNLLAVSQSAKFLNLTQDECAKFLLSEPVVAAKTDDRCRAAIACLNHESPSREKSAECIMSMAALDADGVSSATLILASRSAVIRPVIKGELALTLIDAMAGNMQRTSQLESEQQSKKKQKLEEARGEAWYIPYNITYVIGGNKNAKAFHRYDVAQRQWSTLQDLPWASYYGGVCAVGNRLFVMGGVKDSYASSTIDEYDTVMQTWSTSKEQLGCKRGYLAGAADSNYAYAFGGCNFDFGLKMQTVAERYSVVSKKLESLTAMDNGRFQATAVCKNDDAVFVVGGSSAGGKNGTCRTVDKYDHATKTWSAVAALKNPCFNLGAAFLGDDMFMAGGRSSSKVEVLNTETGLIRFCAANLCHARRGCCAVPLDRNVMCVVGGSLLVPRGSVEVYDNREGKWSVGVIVPDMPERLSFFGLAHVRP